MSTTTESFVNSFQLAVVRLATLQVERNNPGRLIFATVSLLPFGRPPPPKMAGVDIHNLAKKGSKIFFRRVVMSVTGAIDWYRSLEAHPITPLPSRKEDVVEKLDGIPIIVSKFEDDPLWPNLGFPICGRVFEHSLRSSDPAPFIGSSLSRVHRRFGTGEGFETLLSNEAALVFIARRLHINLKDYSEYLGSIVMVVPDPIIKQIDNFMIPANSEQGERIHYRFVPRARQSLAGTQITMFDEQAGLLSGFESKDIPSDGILDIEKGSCCGSYGYVVTHPVHGVLLYRPPAGFIRNIVCNIGVVDQVRKVRVPLGESSRSPINTYSVNRTLPVRGVEVSEELPMPNANVRVGIAANKRDKAICAAHYDQRWFGSGSREEAMDFIRSRVYRARKRIMIADPYFGVLQIPQYLLAITSGDIRIEVLTSRLAFETRFSEEDEVDEKTFCATSSFAEKLGHFNDEIERIKREGNTDIRVMVLKGKSPKLHDRFLVVDDNIWFVGNSLNTLGDRSSMIIKLPNPDEVLSELEDMIKESDDFETYRQRRICAAEAMKV